MASILVIEPEEPVLRLIGWTLIDAGHEVVTTKEFESAVTLAERHQPDLVIVNGPVTAPQLQQKLNRIREIVPQAKVIDLRDDASDYDPERVLLADAVVDKPFPAIDLLDTINSLLSDAHHSD